MTTLIFSIIFLVTGSPITSLIDNSDSYIEVETSKVMVIITEKNVPISGVLVKITQGNMHLGETLTDENGTAIILCKQLSVDNKEVEINATKTGYQSVHIHGNLITSTTDYKFNITKDGEISPQSNDLNFQIQYESLHAELD